jgi:hypothetical protein
MIRMRYTVPLLFLLLAWLIATRASAAVNLPMVCLTPAAAGKPVNASCGGYAQTSQVYRTPQDADLVRVMSDGKTNADWASNAYVWKAWRDVKIAEYYDRCKTDVPQGAPVSNGPCTDWGMWQRWDIGTSATLTWTPPTLNTDGSAITKPISYRLFLDDKPTWNLTATSFVATGLPAGLRCFSITAVTSDGESARTDPLCKQFRIAAPSNGRIEAPSNGSIEPKR